MKGHVGKTGTRKLSENSKKAISYVFFSNGLVAVMKRKMFHLIFCGFAAVAVY